MSRDDEVKRVIDQVSQEVSQDRYRAEVEVYISKFLEITCGDFMAFISNSFYYPDSPTTKSKLVQWRRQHGAEFALKMRRAAEIMIRQELLGEQ